MGVIGGVYNPPISHRFDPSELRPYNLTYFGPRFCPKSARILPKIGQNSGKKWPILSRMGELLKGTNFGCFLSHLDVQNGPGQTGLDVLGAKNTSKIRHPAACETMVYLVGLRRYSETSKSLPKSTKKQWFFH